MVMREKPTSAFYQGEWVGFSPGQPWKEPGKGRVVWGKNWVSLAALKHKAL